jgi:hypothetical protein
MTTMIQHTIDAQATILNKAARAAVWFTIGVMLWLMGVVGLSVGWGLDHSAQKERELEAAKIREFRGQVAALLNQKMGLENEIAPIKMR